MRYFITERKPTEKNMKNAANKARADVEAILEQEGFQNIEIVIPFKGKQSPVQSVVENWKNYGIWKKKLAILEKGDELLVQFPLMSKNILASKLLQQLAAKGVIVTLLIHDLESLRYINRQSSGLKDKLRIQFEEKSVLKASTKVIAHNPKMVTYLKEQGVSPQQLVSLEIFDYLLPGDFEIKKQDLAKEAIIAGNLDASKVGYLASLESIPGMHFQLYGANFNETMAPNNATYHGSFMPEDLPHHLEGSFGLVWDGETINTCSGMYGDYLRFNNPHKTSLYLSCGIPVVIWKEAALADFVNEHGVGIVVADLKDLPDAIADLSQDDYERMLLNTKQVSERLTKGYYLKAALAK
ncbi:galactofuranosyltransferase [Streptococcus saliviloxodontae]|uniref:Galactofuranosyltransferase n=1 Tax=Streptococcus saliviloxodontae TaxID=1349416 RepID=A0ABS2PJS6_9STRE|nr:galactofuranosyltransferase [Streptococcus saliviloxodontae]MBM7635591.1 hypothetical protein [Streptococcus saliviloxodontae]